MLPRLPLAVLTYLILPSLLFGQDLEEAAFLTRQAAELGKFARVSFDEGYPMQARRIWQEILKEYDTDHAASRSALGFRRLGTAWQEDEKFSYPLRDNPDPRSLTKVEKIWEKTRHTVGRAHKSEAERFHTAGRSDRAQWHFARALRFLPDDAGVQAASGMKTFYGLTGSDLEQKLYEQSKKHEAIVASERKRTYEVKELASTDQLVYLIKAGIPHAGYGTEHHKVWSNMEPSLIKELAQNLERSRSFCSQVFTGNPGFHPDGLRCSNFVFLSSEELYKKALQANKDLFRPGELDFLVEHTAMCDLGRDQNRAKISGDPFEAIVRDLSIRWPVDSWGAMRSDALNEGLGHAVVGMFLGKISVYSMDMERQSHTVTKREPGKVLVPNLESWNTMAIESAFRARGAPLAKMPLISASNFPTESRVRAWSFCDYLLRREPRLLLELDATRDAKTVPNVRGQFQKATGIRVDGLEKEWRDFWTGATPVLRALRGEKSPFGASSKDAPKWLKEFNKIRKQYKVRGARNPGEVSWNAVWSTQCKQHGEYLAANRKARGPAAEQTQEEGLTGASKSGELFAQMALVSTKGSPASAMKDWIHLPGYRDAILNPHLMQVGVHARSGIAVFDVVRGVVPPAQGRGGGRGGGGRGGRRGNETSGTYPGNGATGVPRDITLKLLDAAVGELLKEHKPGSKIGYPISLHAWAGSGATSCDVRVGDKPVTGVLHRGGWNRRSSAPGMAVFYPARPFPRGAKVEVIWTLADDRKLTSRFTTR